MQRKRPLKYGPSRASFWPVFHPQFSQSRVKRRSLSVKPDDFRIEGGTQAQHARVEGTLSLRPNLETSMLKFLSYIEGSNIMR